MEKAVSAKQTIDEQMRAAYDRWRTAFYEQDIETTPAYDVIGLLAGICLRSDCDSSAYFDIGLTGSSKNVEQEGAQVYKLKQEYRSKENLGTIFGDLKSLGVRRFKLLVITDFGEETDDEVTCLLCNRLHELGLVDVRLLFTTDLERFEEQKNRFERWGGNPANVASIYNKNDIFSWFNQGSEEGGEAKEAKEDEEKSLILQIGPIHEPTNVAGWHSIWRPSLTSAYDYVVVGTFNGVPALNVKADARASALHLMSGAEDKVVVDTMAGLGAFNFSASALNRLFPFGYSYDESLSYGTIHEHVCRIGWRNSVGRASPFAARFVAHLVSEPVGAFGGGANYMTARRIQEDLGGEVVETPRSRAIAEKYLDQLQNRPGPPRFNFMKLVVSEDGSTNNANGATSESIVNGYAYILNGLHSYFGVPIEFFESGAPEKWNPQWETPSNYDLQVVPDDVVPFKVTESMYVPEMAASESAYKTGIPAGGALIGIGPFTRGVAIQVRSKHTPNTMLLRGHYKLLKSGNTLNNLLTKHMPVSSDILRTMVEKLCSARSRKFEQVSSAIMEQIGGSENEELLNKFIFSTDQWQLI